MKIEQKKYVNCQRCGASILEQCAVEDDGLLLCGDCIAKGTSKQYVEAERKAAEKRQQAYAEEHKKLAKRQKKRAIICLLLALTAFGGAQWFMAQNKPEPVKNADIDFSKDLYSAQALIVVGLDKYASITGKLPANLHELIIRKCVPYPVSKAFPLFKYRRIDNNTYELEKINAAQTQSNSEDNDAAKEK